MTSPSHPRLLLFAGPNGSGKSTLTTPQTFSHFGIAPDQYINADDIASRLADEMPDVPQVERERIAFRRARALRATLRQEGASFAFETVFSHPSTLLDMQECRTAGFEITVLFVTTANAEINVRRVRARVQAQTGHAVPEDRIRSRYERTMALLPRIVEEANCAFVYDNTAQTPIVFSFENGVPLPPIFPVPAFPHDRLFTPLQTRGDERNALAARFPRLDFPSEDAGTYSGLIDTVSAHYMVQQTPSGTFVRHDLLLFADGTNHITGQNAVVRYHEGQGTMET